MCLQIFAGKLPDITQEWQLGVQHGVYRVAANNA
jgi:hypothetical protein